MNKLIFKYDESGNSNISAFAYNTGHLIEELINSETNNLKRTNSLLQARILAFHQQLEEPIKSQYADYFGIEVQRTGTL